MINSGKKLIEVKGLKKNFGALEVLKGIDETIHKGEVVSIIGPSGSGKSTFLRCLNLLEKPSSGQVIFEGVDIADKKINIDHHRQKIGMVFQHFNPASDGIGKHYDYPDAGKESAAEGS